MKTGGINGSRLTRHFYETRLAFLFAILAAVVVIAAFGARARAELRCAADSIATASDRCTAQVSTQGEVVEQGIRLIFPSTP